MPISFSSLFQDSVNFIRNNFKVIFPILLLLTIICQLLDWMLAPSVASLAPMMHIIENAVNTYGDYSAHSVQRILQEMSPQEQQQAVSLSFMYLAKFFFSKLIQIQMTLMFSLALIWQLATYPRFDIKIIATKAISLIWPILGFMLISVPYFLALFILAAFLPPLIYFILTLGSLLYLVIYDLFLVYAVNNRGIPVFKGIAVAFKLLKKQYSMILPIIAIWLGTEMAINFIAFQININNIVVDIIRNILNLLVYFFLFTYFFRLYLLAKEEMYNIKK